MALEVLVVDDEADIRELVSGVLEDEGYHGAHRGGQHGGARRDRGAPAVAGAARRLAAGLTLDGLQLLEEIKRRDPTCRC